MSTKIKNIYLSTRNKIPLSFVKEGVDLASEGQKELKLSQAVLIENTDGVIHTLNELESYSYAGWLTKPLPNKFVLDWSDQFLREGAEATSEEIQFVSTCIQNIFLNKDDENFNIYLITKPYEDYGYSYSFMGDLKCSEEIKDLKCSETLFDEGSLQILEGALRLSLSYREDLSKLRLMGGIFYSISEAKLLYTKENIIREKIKALFSSDRIKFQLKSLSCDIYRDELKRSVSYETSFFEKPFEKIKKLKEVLPVNIRDLIEVGLEENKKFKIKLFPAESDRIQVFSSGKIIEENKSLKDTLTLLLGVKDGVAGFLGKEPSHMAVNGPKRLNELQLFKSSGFFTYLLNYSRKTEVFSEEEAVVFWEEVSPLISQILSESTTADLDGLISPYFKDHIKDVLSILMQTEKYTKILVLDDKIQNVSHKEIIFNFLNPLFSMFQTHYKEKIYLKNNYNEFKVTLDGDKEKGLYLDVFFPFSVDIGEMMKKNTCIIDEEEVVALNPESVKVKFNISDEVNTSGKDWFDLDPKYFFDGKEISEEAARGFKANSVVRYGGKLYYVSGSDIPEVKWLNYFWDRVGKTNKNQGEGDEKDDVSYFRAHVLDVLALRQAGMSVDGDERWEAVAREYDSLNKQSEINLGNFKGALKPFQATGVSWLHQLYRLGLGGILADDMGLGKTVQILAFLNHLKNSSNDPRKNLVVVPTSLVYNWISEAEKFTPELSVQAFKRENKKDLEGSLPDLLVTTYGMLSEHQDFFLNKDWAVVAFDEAQQLKNIKSMRSDISRKINSSMKICLSGTPMENHYGEYFSLIDLSVPGALGEYSEFMKIYGPRKVAVGKVELKDIEYLKLKTKPLVLRRSKNQVLKELPEKTESVVKLNFDEKQKGIYKNIALVWNTKIQNLLKAQGESKSQLQMFAALMKLRQVCSCPDVIEGADYDQLSPKLSLVVDRVEELLISGKSVLVFTNFVMTLEKIKKELQKRSLNVLSITGKDSQKKREDVLVNFNQEGEKALVMTLKTGGVGLNLTKASYIIHVEPWWNPAAENQGTDRVYRIGQKNNVHVYRYIMKNSIEEKIQELKKTKQEAFDALLSDKGDGSSEAVFSGGKGLTQKDFEFLLS